MIVALGLVMGLAVLYLLCSTVVMSFKALKEVQDMGERLNKHFPEDLYPQLTDLELTEKILGEE